MCTTNRNKLATAFLCLYSSIDFSFKSDRKLDFAICLPTPIKSQIIIAVFAPVLQIRIWDPVLFWPLDPWIHIYSVRSQVYETDPIQHYLISYRHRLKMWNCLLQVGKLLSIGTAVILTFGLVWSPFLILGPDACLQVILQNYLIQTNDSSHF